MDLGSRQVAPGNEAHHKGMQYRVELVPGTGSADSQRSDKTEMDTTFPTAAGGMPITSPKDEVNKTE